MSKQSNYVLGYLNDSDLRLLRIFSTIVECGGVTAAESKLNMANSTLSTHLVTLEDHLQMKLCRRGRAGFELTSEGRAVYEAAERMFQSIEEFGRSVHLLGLRLPTQLPPTAPISTIAVSTPADIRERKSFRRRSLWLRRFTVPDATFLRQWLLATKWPFEAAAA